MGEHIYKLLKWRHLKSWSAPVGFFWLTCREQLPSTLRSHSVHARRPESARARRRARTHTHVPMHSSKEPSSSPSSHADAPPSKAGIWAAGSVSGHASSLPISINASTPVADDRCRGKGGELSRYPKKNQKKEHVVLLRGGKAITFQRTGCGSTVRYGCEMGGHLHPIDAPELDFGSHHLPG